MSGLMRRARHILAYTLVISFLLTGLAGVTFLLLGGKYFVVETPSMATYAPVGTLVVGAPTTYEQVKPGSMLLFTPPGSTETYFHRVVAVTKDGIKTQGDLNANPDPWSLRASNIQGRELVHVVNLGWLAKALPILGMGLLAVFLLVRFLVDVKWRVPSYIAGSGLIIAIANAIVHPWFRSVTLYQTVKDHHLYVQLVSTGIFPLDVHLSGAKTVVARTGVVSDIIGSEPNGAKHFVFQVLPHFDAFTLTGVVLLTAAPMIASICYMIYAHSMGWDLLPELLVQTEEEQTSHFDQLLDQLLADAESQRYLDAAADGWSAGHINAMWHNRLALPASL